MMDMVWGWDQDPAVLELAQMIHSWTSVLDCRLSRGEYGLEMEVVTFPGEKLPKLPSCAKRLVRAWDPEKDEPFFYVPGVNKY